MLLGWGCFYLFNQVVGLCINMLCTPLHTLSACQDAVFFVIFFKLMKSVLLHDGKCSYSKFWFLIQDTLLNTRLQF